MLSERDTLLEVLKTPGIHEKEISRTFSGKMRYEGDGQVFEKPLTVMAFTNRCGSNLLADYLNQTGEIGGFHESLNYDTVANLKEKEGIDSFPCYINNIFERFSVNGFLGIKSSYDQLLMLSRSGVLEMFPSLNVIHVRRSDVVSQAVSHWIAHQTKKWTSKQEGITVEPTYNSKSIDKIISSINKSNSVIPIISRVMGARFAGVLYEGLVQDPLRSVTSVGTALSLDFSKWAPITPKISKQSNETNRNFYIRFNEELKMVMI